jgi:DNA-binding response OmpR family regulator
LQKILQRLFSAEGYEVGVVPDGTAGLEMLRQRPPVAVILDIERSGNSERDFCKQIAKSIPNTPLIVRSARSRSCRQGRFPLELVPMITGPFP